MFLPKPNKDEDVTCLNCKERKKSLLCDLNNDELKLLAKNKYTAHYKYGEIICKEGTKPLGLVCLNRGKVKIVRSGANGIPQIIGLKKAVDFIAFRALMGGIPCLASYIALEDSNVCIIRKKDFFKVIENNNNLAFKIIQMLALNLINTDGRLVSLTQKHARSRLAEALLLVNEIYGINRSTGILNVSLKRSELAELSNLTTSNAIRVLSTFNKEKLVDVDHRNIKINDLSELRKISDFGNNI